MSDLGHVIWLLHGARERYSTLKADVDVTVDVAHLPSQDDTARPAELQRSTVTLWVDPPWRWRVRWREETPFDAGRDGWRAWTTERNGDYVVGIDGRIHVEWPTIDPQPLEQLWDPALLISELWLEPQEDRIEIAGRAGRVVGGRPRPTPRPDGRQFLLLDWPLGDRYELLIDEQLGIVLRLRVFSGEWEIVREEFTAVAIDEPIDPAIFRGDAEP